ncbi:hypothetical protein [Absidia glauca]|uniref:Uncharacterized protein n=1 Tax=Absidia glauca TaxID=4829 RepID=A0A163K7B9_ABSGL|nr:hypothetical protein [Absidia glauca]
MNLNFPFDYSDFCWSGPNHRTHPTLPHYYPPVPLIFKLRQTAVPEPIQNFNPTISPRNAPWPLIEPLKAKDGAQIKMEPGNGASVMVARRDHIADSGRVVIVVIVFIIVVVIVFIIVVVIVFIIVVVIVFIIVVVIVVAEI